MHRVRLVIRNTRNTERDKPRDEGLTCSLSHLSALAPESSHALLSPLGAHATVDVQLGKRKKGSVKTVTSLNLKCHPKRTSRVTVSESVSPVAIPVVRLLVPVTSRIYSAGMNSTSSMAALMADTSAESSTVTTKVRSKDLTNSCIP